MSILINILLVIHVLVSLLIILLVLMQRPKNEGLGAAFGGGMTDNLFGAQTTNVLQSGTRWLGGIFFGLTLLLSFLYVHSGSTQSGKYKSLSESAIPAATPAPATPAPVPSPPVKAPSDGNAVGTPPVESEAPPKTENEKPAPAESAKPDTSKDNPPAPDAPKPQEPPK